MPTVLITGANRGLGLALCGQYLARGWSVICLSRSASPELERLVEKGEIESHYLDLTDDAALADFAAGLADRGIDVVINNAGTMGRRNFAEFGLRAGEFGTFDRAEWHDIFDINLFTPMRLSELLVENLASGPGGRIVTLSSMLGSMGLNTVGGLYAYRASKAAVNAIVKSMAIDLAPRGIIAVAMHPGFVRTDMSGSAAEIDPRESAEGMVEVIDRLEAGDTGKVLAWDGSVLPW
jgi:NAD(P)-dependent dehydrogenase (short-subunit alcohol dehydrogenase family)